MVRKQIIGAALAAAIAILLAGLPRATARAASDVAVAQVSVTASPFPRPAALEPSVDFWIKAFTDWSERDFVVHDRDDVSRIYQTFHMPGEGAPSGEEIEWANAYLKAKYGDILNRLATGQQPIGWEEQRVAAMFKGQPASAYAAAAQNLRVQQGLCEQFRESLLRSRYYRPRMEQVFARAGLPPELVALASVESGFSARVRSSAGALGIWQFTRSTGREFLKITRYRDDRLDPVRSTQAAAELLQSNYQALGSWPLAITAYNYGTAGMERAASEYGSDFMKIVRNYDGPHFGFAVKNYYAEFLAADQVDRYQDKYFPGIESEEAPPPPFSSPILRRIIHHFRHHHHHYHHVHVKRVSTTNRAAASTHRHAATATTRRHAASPTRNRDAKAATDHHNDS
ncbi:MAG TPA: lytic transglycosylase domain-containing protein [Candidatus Binataceae bacterium]|nr:lytic transglycosylase domain-containing protein [Candidatus Binataceae bacterium]